MTSSNGNIFRIAGPLWGNLQVTLMFSLMAPEQTVEQTIETVVIWEAIAYIMISL